MADDNAAPPTAPSPESSAPGTDTNGAEPTPGRRQRGGRPSAAGPTCTDSGSTARLVSPPHFVSRGAHAATFLPIPLATATAGTTATSSIAGTARTTSTSSTSTSAARTTSTSTATDAAIGTNTDAVELPDEEEPESFTTKGKRESEWESVILEKVLGRTSTVFEYLQFVSVKPGVEIPKDKRYPLNKISCGGGDFHVCLLCKEMGKSLDKSLRFLLNGATSNPIKHLKDCHKARIQELKAAKEEARKKRTRGNKEAVDDANKKKKQKIQPSISSSVTTVPPKQNKMDELYYKMFRFINNNALPIETVHKPEFRDLIQFCIDYGKYLRGYQPMGRRRYISIQCSSFQSFIASVSDKVSEVRQWYVDTTGTSQPFISVAHDVWEGNPDLRKVWRKKL